MRSTRLVTALTVLAGWSVSAIGAEGPKEAGVWYDDSGKGAVKVEMCGNKLCGKIYWLKDPLNAEGKPLYDRHNPNEAERGRPICGLQVFGNLANMGDGTWDSGWIYDPKEGKSYSVAMELADQDTLKVTGYLVMKMMGRTLTWKRAPADLPSCAQNAAAPKSAVPAGAAAAAAALPAAKAKPATPAATSPQAAAPAAKTRQENHLAKQQPKADHEDRPALKLVQKAFRHVGAPMLHQDADDSNA